MVRDSSGARAALDQSPHTGWVCGPPGTPSLHVLFTLIDDTPMHRSYGSPEEPPEPRRMLGKLVGVRGLVQDSTSAWRRISHLTLGAAVVGTLRCVQELQALWLPEAWALREFCYQQSRKKQQLQDLLRATNAK